MPTLDKASGPADLPPHIEPVLSERTNQRTQRNAGQGGQKAEQAGAFRAGTPTNPYEEERVPRAVADCRSIVDLRLVIER